MSEGVVTRRHFLSGSLALGAGSYCGLAQAETVANGFAAMIREIGWQPDALNSFFFLHATDLHATELTSGALKMPKKFEGRNFVDDMNQLRPTPSFVALTGDLIAAITRNPNTWPKAEAGFRRLNDLIVSRFKMPCHMIIGNNDCSHEAYRKVWPKRPVYWSFDQQGVHFVGLHGYHLWQPENTNHAGILLDDQQLAWLKRDLSAAAKSQTCVLFTHEPLKDADCHRIRRQLAPIVQEFPGEIWNIAGHNHGNAENRIHIGNKAIRVLETTTPVGVWTPDKGAYRMVFVSNGRVMGMGLRWLTKDGEPLHFEAMAPGRRVPEMTLVEEALAKEALCVLMVGEEDLPLRQEISEVTDRLSNLEFRKGATITYRVPLALRGQNATRIRLACSPALNIACSAEGTTWQKAEDITQTSGVVTVRIPVALRQAAMLNVRIETSEGKSGRLYGFAFLPD